MCESVSATRMMNQCEIPWIHLDPLHANRFDDGVAVHGCSDCSGSSSSGHSDIADPGSPYSTSSEDSGAPSPARATPTSFSKMPPMAPSLKPGEAAWPWTTESDLVQPVSPPPESLPSAPTTASKCNVKREAADCPSELVGGKRIKAEQTTLCVQSCQHNTTSSPVQCVDSKKRCCGVKNGELIKLKNITTQPKIKAEQRGKITQYFKPQKQPDVRRIPLDKVVKEASLEFSPYLTTIIANKANLPNVPTAPPDKAAQTVKLSPESLSRIKSDIRVSTASYKDIKDVKDVKSGTNGLLPPSKLPDVVPKELNEDALDVDDMKKPIMMSSIMVKNGKVPEMIKMEPTSLSQPVALCSRLDEKWAVCSESPSSPNPSIEPAIASTPHSTPASHATPTILSAKSTSTPTKPVSNTMPTERTMSCALLSDEPVCSEISLGVTTDNVSEKASKVDLPEAVIPVNGLSKFPLAQLTVNTAATFLPPTAVAAAPKSPILSAPKSIRFPCPSNSSHPDPNAQRFKPVFRCRWTDCPAKFDCDIQFFEHLQSEHIRAQILKTDTFFCMWVGCKVYGRSSCSRSWLERHVSSHGGNKPFRCVVEGCGARFGSLAMLERHVNMHFQNKEGSGSSGSAPRRSLDTTPNKLIKRCGRKLRLRRQPWTGKGKRSTLDSQETPQVIKARQFDYFDSGVMEGLQHRLLVQAEKTPIDWQPGCCVQLQSKVIAQRTQSDGKPCVLLRWFPRNIVADEWVPKKDIQTTRTVRLKDYMEEPLQPLSSLGNSLQSSPMSSPTSSSSPSLISSPSLDSGDEGPSTSNDSSHLWVLQTAAEMAAKVVNTMTQQPRKQRRKPLKTAAVT